MCCRTGKYTVCRRVSAAFSPEILQARAVKGLMPLSMTSDPFRSRPHFVAHNGADKHLILKCEFFGKNFFSGKVKTLRSFANLLWPLLSKLSMTSALFLVYNVVKHLKLKVELLGKKFFSDLAWFSNLLCLLLVSSVCCLHGRQPFCASRWIAIRSCTRRRRSVIVSLLALICISYYPCRWSPLPYGQNHRC